MSGAMSRRALLGGLVGSLVAMAGKALPAAATGEPLLLGQQNGADDLTRVISDTQGLWLTAQQGFGLRVTVDDGFAAPGVQISVTDGSGLQATGDAYGVLASGSIAGLTATGDAGAILRGKRAALSMPPGTRKIHPVRGQTGDLYVDTKKRLWYCRDGTDWVRLA